MHALPAELTIYTAAETKALLLSWLPGNGELVLDGARVDAVDGAGLQLLLAMSHSLRAAGRGWRIDRPSAPLAHACAGAGLGALLGDA